MVKAKEAMRVAEKFAAKKNRKQMLNWMACAEKKKCLEVICGCCHVRVSKFIFR